MPIVCLLHSHAQKLVVLQLVGVNAQSVQQVSTAFLGLLEAAGQAAGEVAGVLGAPRSIGSSTAPSAAAEADHHRMQRRRVLRWGIGLVVLLGGYHAFRGLAGSAGAASARARRRLSWLQVACHLLVLLASAGAGYGVGPQALLEGGRSAIDALKAVAKGEDPLALPPPDASTHGDQQGAGDRQGAHTTDAAAGGAADAAAGGVAASPVRRAVMSPADARAILHSVMEGESDSDGEEGGEGGGESLPAVVEASPMVPGSAAGTPAQAAGLPFAGHDESEPAAQRALDF